MRRLTPDPGPTTVDEQFQAYRPWEEPRAERPLVAVNFAATVDGRATIGGVSGPIGSAAGRGPPRRVGSGTGAAASSARV